jgi:dihydrofolate reductase
LIYLIVAADPNGVIGKDNTIPWHLPEDLKLFKKRTMGSSIVMGRATWDSLPKKPLPGRRNYILTRSVPWRQIENTIWCDYLPDIINDAKRYADYYASLTEQGRVDLGGSLDIYIIGGEQVYKEALKLNVVDRIILSKLKKEHDGNRYFKVPENWVEYQRDGYQEFDVIYFVKD